MEFDNSPQAIYLQIADYVIEKILLEIWPENSKIPSVRELAIQLEVNPNTVARAYDFLKNIEIITDKRGIGYFVADDGMKKATAYRKQSFLEKELPAIFRSMHLLGVEPADLATEYNKFKKQFKH